MVDSLHRKDRLILTTIDIIDELGIQSLSTREIAKREGVSEATLFRHFKSKNDLLAAVLEYYSKFDDDIYQTTGINKLKPFFDIWSARIQIFH
jgi:AcrR family transcriptional regulator